jgi:hypothetical protein
VHHYHHRKGILLFTNGIFSPIKSHKLKEKKGAAHFYGDPAVMSKQRRTPLCPSDLTDF